MSETQGHILIRDIMAIRAGITQKQSVGMSPEHILGKAVLKMSLQELQQFVLAQFGENPALTLDESTECPACHSILTEGVCLTCGSREIGDSDGQTDDAEDVDWQEDMPASASEAFDLEYPEPFAGIAAPQSLTDHLKAQISDVVAEEDLELAEFIIDSLDEDGYLREPMLEIAGRFGRSVPQAEVIVRQIQRLDPPGIAARDLRECLLIQALRLDVSSEERQVAEALIRDHWDIVSRMKLDEAARQMDLSRRDVESALRFIQEYLDPHPAAMFRDPWQQFAPRRVPRSAPDVVIRSGEDGAEAEVADPVSGQIKLDEIYANLYEDMCSRDNGFTEADRAHIKEFVTKAKSVIEALEFRKSSLRKITDEILRRQAEFLAEGPTALKPMTKKELAQSIGIHESTVCRATQDKTMLLPSGDVISFDLLFDSALPVKHLVRQLAAERLSDGEIAKRLEEAGIQIARRTVAKYRDQLRVLPVEYRFAG